ncbi:MAG: hypothetical protein ACT4PM_14960, partial [Gemmatimonadales bacterium]
AASSAEWAEAEATVERFVMTRPRALRRQLNALIGFLEIAARLRHGTRLARLAPRQRTRLLEGLARSRVLLLRRGIWGLRTLVMLGWYTQAGVAATIGYRASPGGWDARR